MKKAILLFFFTISTFFSFACDNSTVSIVSQTTNPNGSITYVLNINIELGGLDVSHYGFVLAFNSPFNTPTVTNFDPTLSNADLTSGSISNLTGLTGANINSVVNDGDWSIYDNKTNVLSYEYGGIFAAASNDYIFTTSVTVMGCVEEIFLDANVNAANSQCYFTQTTNQNCAVCSITAVTAGTQTACNPATNTYTQQVTVTYSNPPGVGTLNVNGQTFAITSSPQTVTLTGLNANGNSVNLNASFSNDLTCTFTQNNLFTAPIACPPACSITAITAGTQTACNPATNTYTQQVTITYANPPATGTLNVNGQTFAITSSPQTVTLTGLSANGNSVNVTALFSANASCTFTQNNLFTAPVACNSCNADSGTISK